MKKLLLAGFVVATFILYSFVGRRSGNSVVIAKPASLGGNSPTSQSTPVPSTGAPAASSPPSSKYKDGQYTGAAEDAFYGYIQVEATISGGKITNVQFLQAPNDRSTSVEINQQADPDLAQEAIQAQSAQVDVVSGATDSSEAFVQSLSSALQKAHS
jgi:uncharacterized protein with FMN-binding domain